MAQMLTKEVLEVLDGKNISLLKETDKWDFWVSEFPTPAGTLSAYYVYLNHSCPLSEATDGKNLAEWAALSKNATYNVIVTPKSDLLKEPAFETIKATFAGKKILTLEKLLQENFFSKYTPRKEILSSLDAFVDPTLEKADGSLTSAISHLVEWLIHKDAKKEGSPRVAVLSASGGIGKTTLAKEIASRLLKSGTGTIPLLIESAQWERLASERMEIDDVWDAAIENTFENAAGLKGNHAAIRVLIRTKLLIPIFDGFDELCLTHKTMTPQDLINELIAMVGDTAGAKILVTTRETFWDLSYEAAEGKNIERFKLRGFDADQRTSYFKKRLKDSSDRQTATRIASQIHGNIYPSLSGARQGTDSLAGLPFILNLIADSVDGTHGSWDTVNPYSVDPLGGLFTDICERDNIRHKLNFSKESQMEFFEELFRAHNEGISVDDLYSYLDAFGLTNRTLQDKFVSHTLLARDSQNRMRPRYEIIRTYFLARFLATRLQRTVTRPEEKRTILELMSKNKGGKTETLDLLVTQFREISTKIKQEAIQHALRIIQEGMDSGDEPTRETAYGASSTLFHLTARLATSEDKKEQTAFIAQYLGKSVSPLLFERIALENEIKGLSFSGVNFSGAVLTNVVFTNCDFDKNTSFVGCCFTGTIEFNNCRGQREVQLDPTCKFSEDSEIAWKKQKGEKMDAQAKRRAVVAGLKLCLEKFLRPFGFSGIQFQNRFNGRFGKHPFRDEIWDELLRSSVIITYTISNVKDGGCKITHEEALRKEIREFFASGHIGKGLTAVVEKILK